MKRLGNILFAISNLADAFDLAWIAARMTGAGESLYRRAAR